ncbi:Protein of unknown function DUF2985 [Dillenia turbinata]|uniref:PLAC8 family protein n=1 Tax=Dillenia turbinata TaxID=194707 RepID=A0AAN8ZMU6_9MAGN
MVSVGNEEGSDMIREELGSAETPKGYKANGHANLPLSTSRKGLLSVESAPTGIQIMLAKLPSKARLLRSGSSTRLSSPSAKFWEIAQERDEISRAIPSTSTRQRLRERIHGVLHRKIDWASFWKMSKEWFKNPMNIALFIWISFVAISGAILFLVMTGMLNGVIPKKSDRDTWYEVNNQILNALFTLMCLYQHPKRTYHLVLLLRWKPKDIAKLRKEYCKNGTYKPHEWAHMMVVITLLHINCFAQYALCGLNLGYRRSQRPAFGVALCLSVAIAAPAIAGVYLIASPLGKDYDDEVDEEAPDQRLTPSRPPRISLEKRFSFATRDEQRIVETRPQWSGGIFDFWDDLTSAYLSLFCCFCVFGWNMERLGFGNMYVHIATFLLFCVSPFWIFILAAGNIDNGAVREALGMTGVVLCMFGLLYGGFWRIQMRKRYNLPPSDICCGKPEVADCALWLFCCWCSLAQEVRSADSYDIVEDKFYRKQMDENMPPPLSPLPREDGAMQTRSGQSSPNWNSPSPSQLRMENYQSPSRLSGGYHSPEIHLPKVDEESSRGAQMKS